MNNQVVAGLLHSFSGAADGSGLTRCSSARMVTRYLHKSSKCCKSLRRKDLWTMASFLDPCTPSRPGGLTDAADRTLPGRSLGCFSSMSMSSWSPCSSALSQHELFPLFQQFCQQALDGFQRHTCSALPVSVYRPVFVPNIQEPASLKSHQQQANAMAASQRLRNGHMWKIQSHSRCPLPQQQLRAGNKSTLHLEAGHPVFDDVLSLLW